jgi:hypothetical protein
MKTTSRTIQILKNFSTINPAIVFKPGQVLRTMSPLKTVLAQANVVEQFDSEFAIMDLSRFLSVLSLFNDPSIDFHSGFMAIKDGQQKAHYRFADPKVISTMMVLPSEKTPQVPDPEIQFKLTQDVLSRVQKGMAVFSMPELAVCGDGANMTFEAVDSKKPSQDNFAVSLGTTPHVFRMVFKSENIKLIPGDYDVSISSKGIGHFVGEDVQYWIATEASSTFGG